MKPVDVKPNIYIDFNKENNKEGSKFKFGDHVITSKYKNIFTKRYVPNWSKKVFVIRKIKSTVRWTYFISDLKGEEILEYFMKNNCKTRSKRGYS